MMLMELKVALVNALSTRSGTPVSVAQRPGTPFPAGGLNRVMDDHIRIRGARQHNLKGLDLDLPRGALTVITGRESEALFDTLLYLRRSGFAVTLFLVQPGRPSVELRKRSDLLSLPVHRVWREVDLEVWG